MEKSTYWNIMKGLGIVAIVIGHAGSPLHPYVYMYHLSLFFFISGFLYNDKYSMHPTGLVGKKIKSLYIPFILYNLVYLIFHNILLNINIYNRYQLGGLQPIPHYGVRDFITAANNILMFSGAEQLGGAMWFVIALFSLNIIFSVIRYFCLKGGKYNILCTAILIIILATFGFWRIKEQIYIGLNVDIALIVLPIFFVGFLFRYYRRQIPLHWPIALVCAAIVYIAYSKFHYSNFDIRSTQHPLIFLFTAFSGIYVNLYIGKVINISKKLSLLFDTFGKYSFHIMALHFLCFKLISLIYIIIYRVPIENLAKFPVITGKWWLWICYSVVGVGLPIAIIKGLKYAKGKLLPKTI
jgi:fucose 4-O-acetylase-like acetyltransferase